MQANAGNGVVEAGSACSRCSSGRLQSIPDSVMELPTLLLFLLVPVQSPFRTVGSLQFEVLFTVCSGLWAVASLQSIPDHASNAIHSCDFDRMEEDLNDNGR